MIETFWYFEYTEEQLEQIAEESRLAQGGVAIDFEEPVAYSGQILEYDDGGTDGSRLTNPTPIDQTPTDAGYVDIDLVVGVLNDDSSSILDPTSGILRIEQHPSMYGTPLRVKFTCQLDNGSQPTNNNIIVSTPYIAQGALYIQVGLVLSENSTINQEDLVAKLDSITYGGNYVMITSIQSDSSSPLVAFSSLSAYNNSGTIYQDLCADPKTFLTTEGNPDAQLESGLPYIEGIFEQGRLLSVSLIDITDRDTTFPYGFQWYREETVNGIYSNVAIDGATSILYSVSSDDVSKNITVSVTYINNAGEASQKNSPPVYIANNISTADITISAESYRVGNLVTAELANIRDRNGVKNTSNYRWQRSNAVPLFSNSPWNAVWTNIDGATSTFYEITESDEQRRLRFAIDVTDNLDEVTTVASSQSSVVNSSPSGELNITGVATPGSYIYASVNFSDADVYQWQYKTRTYTWYVNTFPVYTSTGTNYTEHVNRYLVKSEDYGKQIHVDVTYIDDRDFEETMTSLAVSVVGNLPEGLAISGLNEVGGTISADLSDFQDSDITTERFDSDGSLIAEGKPLPSEILYRWKIVNGDYLTPEGNEYNSIPVTEDMYGETIELTIRYPDELIGEGTYKTSTATKAIVNSLPQGTITLVGNPVGVRLPVTLSVGDITDVNHPTEVENATWDFNYSFSVRQRNQFGNLLAEEAATGVNVQGTMKGADTVVYTIPAEYDNSRLIATVTYIDGEGVEHTLSDFVEVPEVGYPTVDGTLEQGQILSLNTSAIENLASINSIKWYRYNGVDFDEIVGATQEQYEVLSDDVEKYILVEVNYATNASDTETRQSEPLLIINSLPAGQPLIDNNQNNYAQGYATGDELSSSLEHIVDANGVKSFYDYQWYRQTNASAYTTRTYQEDTSKQNIEGATGTTYIITQEDEARRIGYKVKLLDNLDKVHQLDSGLSWRRVDYTPTGFIRVKRQNDNNISSAGIGDILSIDFSQYVDYDGVGNTYYGVWFVDNIEQSQKGKTYEVKAEDYQKSITVTLHYNDLQNNDPKQSTSTNSFSITDTPADGLYLQGTALPGNTLTVDFTHLNEPDGFPGEANVTYQWYKNNNIMQGETARNYVVQRDDYNEILKVVVEYTDNNGNLEQPEVAVLVGNSEPQGSVLLTGDSSVGSIITIDVSNITDVYGPETDAEKESTEFTYELSKINQNNDVTIVQQGTIFGNQTDQYTVQQSDQGSSLRATAVYLDIANGNQKEVSSNTISIPLPPEEEPEEEIGASIVNEENPYQGSITAQGAGLKTVKLLSSEYIISYNTAGNTPNIQNYTISATAYNHVEPIYYKFYRLTADADVEIGQGPGDNSNTRTIQSSFLYSAETVYRVDTFEGSADSTIIASDLVIIYGVKE